MEKIACIVILLLYGVVMLLMCCITLFKKNKKPKNKVHFYVTCELNYYGEIILSLWIGKPYYTKDKRFVSDAWSSILAVNGSFALYNLNYSDFVDMKEGEIREIFINMED